jgi:hypothetical protein
MAVPCPFRYTRKPVLVMRLRARSKQEEQTDREQWPWRPGSIVERCGPDEWYVCVEVRELAVLRDGRRAPRGTASRNPLLSLLLPGQLGDPATARIELGGQRSAPELAGRKPTLAEP